jgi:ATP-dependent exoDNAse (exonuclease V) beta subunit
MNFKKHTYVSSFLVYKASAGSGKTFTLAVHYIKLLVLAETPAEYSHILAVTFTNKATTEMKDRILSQLYGIGNGLPSGETYLQALRESIQKDGLELPADDELRRRCREALHFILHDYNRFRVQTIDSFFQTILRGLAHELGLTANLQVDISDRDVLSQAVDRLVDRLQDDPVLLDWMMSLVRDQIENNQRWDVTSKVKSFGSAIFNENFVMRGQNLRRVLSDDKAFREFISKVTAISQDVEPTVKALGASLYAMVEGKGLDFTDFSNGNTLRTFADKLRAGDMSITPGVKLQQWAYDPLTLVTVANRKKRPDLIAAADDVSSLLSDILRIYLEQQKAYNSSKLVLNHVKKLRLLANIDEEVALVNAENSRFTLAKTPVLLHSMIGESDAPFVFEKIGAALRHVIIDEFQDTSHLQWLNFKALLLETLAKGGNNLIVGDVKQSIYRFRGGDWRMLGSIETSMTPPPVVRTLDYNFRSLRNVIEFNNQFFEKAVPLMDSVAAKEIELTGEPFSFAQAYADVHQKIPASRPDTGYVRVVSLPSKEFKDKVEGQTEIINQLKEQVRKLHEGGLAYNDMTILVRFKSEAVPIINAFAADPDMPAIISDEAFFFSASEAVQSIISALRVLNDETDVVPASFLQRIYPDVEPFTDEERIKLLQQPLYELCEALCRRYKISRLRGQEAYLAAFFDELQDFTHRESADIKSFIDYWDEHLSGQTIPSAAIEGIRIITVHKSKGMEFHTLFIPFCSWPFVRQTRKDNLIWCTPDDEPYSELGLIPITPTSMALNSVFAKDYARELLLSRIDELNVLYVALTRACNNLLVWTVGDEENLAKPSATVGDLLVSVYPDGYEYGEAVVESKANDEESDNRLQADRVEVDVPFCNYPVRAVFRQSNSSKQFIVDAQTTDEQAIEVSRQRQYIEIGNLLHSVLQQMAVQTDMPRVLDALEHEGIITRTISDGTYVSVSRDDVEKWLKQGFNNDMVSDWFSGRWRLFNECAIISRQSDSDGFDNKRPDRVMVSSDGRRVVVVDYKFGNEHEGYHDQVRAYMKLLSEMYPDAKVEGYLWFVYRGLVKPVRAKASKKADTSQMTFDF